MYTNQRHTIVVFNLPSYGQFSSLTSFASLVTEAPTVVLVVVALVVVVVVVVVEVVVSTGLLGFAPIVNDCHLVILRFLILSNDCTRYFQTLP